ncbi:MAG: hypothetical protein IPI67_15780 [Myxococcales bacterium]|nr:hypothetical protein [Myxococcales bacterium]
MKLGHPLTTLCSLAGAFLVAACGDSSSDEAGAGGSAGAGVGGGASGGASGAAAAYSAKFVADPAGLHVGKAHFELELTQNTDGAPASGLASALKLSPLMKMAMMSHGAPVPEDAVTESATPGTYDCTLFFPMASVDMGGNPQGEWSLAVAVGAETVGVSSLAVMPPVDQDTTHAALKNAADTIDSMGSAKPRSWLLFRDTLAVTAGGHELTLFLATVQAGMMVWPPAAVGLKLVDAAGVEQMTVQSLELQASVDGTTWLPLSCDPKARCVAELSGLPHGSATSVYVKLEVNGRAYTTDGSPADVAKKNGFATFSVTAP